MEAVLLRTGSAPNLFHNSFVPGSPRISHPVYDSIGGVVSGERSHSSSPRRISLLWEPKRQGLRRALSEPDVIRSSIERFSGVKALSKIGSCSFPPIIPEEELASESDTGSSIRGSIGSLTSTEERRSSVRDFPESPIVVEDLGFPGGGNGKNRKTGGNDGAGGGGQEFQSGKNADLRKIGAYYQEMVTSNPSDSLILRNYANYLHEVERDMVKAEEYYGRAILASPGDGELLSLYGKLIWETQKDKSRAESYFDQAVHASPSDCMVLGSYAEFMWEAEEDEELACADTVQVPAMVGAY